MALAAYNAGTSRIMGCIVKGANRDFWSLSEQNVLPSETIDYIPKFLAATIIGNNPKRFGFKNSTKNENFNQSFRAVTIPTGVSLKNISNILNLNYYTLKSLNPELIRNYVPSWSDEYELKIPLELDKNISVYKKIASFIGKRNKVNKSKPGFYTVKKGDNLTLISKKLNISVGDLKKNNGLVNSSLIRIGQKLKINKEFSGIYIVKKGDNLYLISNIYNTTPHIIKKLNGLRSSRIYPGQRLRVTSKSSNYYVVKQGDTLWDIADRNHTSIKQILSINSLDNTNIYIGQKLKVTEL